MITEKSMYWNVRAPGKGHWFVLRDYWAPAGLLAIYMHTPLIICRNISCDIGLKVLHSNILLSRMPATQHWSKMTWYHIGFSVALTTWPGFMGPLFFFWFIAHNIFMINGYNSSDHQNVMSKNTEHEIHSEQRIL